jgi:hypothetical protein
MKNGWRYLYYPVHNSQGKSKIIILPKLMESRVQTDCWQTNFIDWSHIRLFFWLLTMIYLCSCPVAYYLDDWIQMRLLFPCSLWKMDDAIFNFYTIPVVRAKSSSRLYWWRVESNRVESRQIVDKQTSLIDHTFDCFSDYWQWFNGAHAQLHITLTTEFRLDCSFRVVNEKWLMLFLTSTQFPR